MEIKNILPPIGNVVPLASVKHADETSQDLHLEQQKDKQTVDETQTESIDTSADVEEKQIEKALSEVNDFFQNEQRKLTFSVNEAVGDVVIEIRDYETNEVIRQIPQEFVIKMAEHLNELADDSVGVLLKEKA